MGASIHAGRSTLVAAAVVIAPAAARADEASWLVGPFLGPRLGPPAGQSRLIVGVEGGVEGGVGWGPERLHVGFTRGLDNECDGPGLHDAVTSLPAIAGPACTSSMSP